MRNLNDIGDLHGKRVFLRLDLNVPIDSGSVRDDFRIKSSLPTVKRLLDGGAKVIIGSHIESDTDSLIPVFEYLKGILPISFVDQYEEEGNWQDRLACLKSGEAIMLENLRLDSGEKSNSKEYAAKLSRLADLYVNDAFSVSHRPHASVVGIPEHISGYAGLQFEREVAELSSVFSPGHPFVFILGGAKFETKLPLINRFLGIADTVFVGGALANDIFKERGLEIGKSVVSKDGFDLSLISKDPKILLPSDVTVENEAKDTSLKKSDEVLPTEAIWDAGPETLKELKELISKAKYILWNGPLGYYEAGFTKYTEELAQAIAESSAKSIVGGGDTLAAISKLGLNEKFSFISTGGGAMLDFLANGTLPGIKALS